MNIIYKLKKTHKFVHVTSKENIVLVEGELPTLTNEDGAVPFEWAYITSLEEGVYSDKALVDMCSDFPTEVYGVDEDNDEDTNYDYDKYH